MIRWFLLVSLIVTALAARAGAADPSTDIAADYEAEEGGWRLVLSPYALLASQSTDVGGEQLRQSFDDLSSLTNVGFQMIANVYHRGWILTADGTYANLGASNERALLRTELDIDQSMLDLRLGYLVHNRVDHEQRARVVRGWALEVNAGAKYWRNDVTLDYRLQLGDTVLAEGREEVTQSWWDPMIGAKARIILSRSVLLAVSLNAGGFGIGDASTISWDFTYTNTFKVSQLILVTAGFRSFRYDRTEGEGEGELETRVSVLGPVIGVSFVF
jgi:hypothetical protein